MTSEPVKTCRKCGESKPLEQFEPAETCRDGRRGSCRTCRNRRFEAHNKAEREASALRRAQRMAALAVETERTCNRCGETKPLDQFAKGHDRRANGRRRTCSTCINIAHRMSWPKMAPGHQVAALRRALADFSAHCERRRESSRRQRERNPEASRAAWERHAAKHPEKRAAYIAVQHAKERGEIEVPVSCPKCGSETPRHRMHAHHGKGYVGVAQLDVELLCSGCHALRHRRERAAERGDGVALKMLETEHA